MMQAGRTGLLQRGWRGFCVAVVRTFYRRREAYGLERIPSYGAVLLCANHPNAAVAKGRLMYRGKDRIIENIKGFSLFMRKRRLRDYLLDRRKELEQELARMTRLLKR